MLAPPGLMDLRKKRWRKMLEKLTEDSVEGNYLMIRRSEADPRPSAAPLGANRVWRALPRLSQGLGFKTCIARRAQTAAPGITSFTKISPIIS